ncbi:Fe-S-cluster-containing dehydrogenase component [Rhodoferax antarcticus]|nr:Fe-S-cluster-containing dehydrogenase component [Rhodoferax antarcticus]
MPDTKVTSNSEEMKGRVFMVFVFRVCVGCGACVAARCLKSLVASLFVAVSIRQVSAAFKAKGTA